MIKIEDLNVRIGHRKILSDINIEIEDGKWTCLVGPNGAGKTTLFNLISGMNKTTSGEILFCGEPIQKIHAHKIAQKGLIRTFQGAKIIRRLTVVENLMMAVQGNPGDNLTGFFRPKSRKFFESKARDEALIRLEQVGLSKFADEYAGILSGGQRKLLDLSRALMASPKLILLDEPFAGVDPIAVEDIQSIVSDLRKRNIGILITDHNVQETLSITDRAYLLFEGKILKSGTAEELAADEQVRKVYLGQNFVLRKK